MLCRVIRSSIANTTRIRNSHPEVFHEEMLLKILQNLPEDTFDVVFFDKGAGWRSSTIYYIYYIRTDNRKLSLTSM